MPIIPSRSLSKQIQELIEPLRFGNFVLLPDLKETDHLAVLHQQDAYLGITCFPLRKNAAELFVCNMRRSHDPHPKGFDYQSNLVEAKLFPGWQVEVKFFRTGVPDYPMPDSPWAEGGFRVSREVYQWLLGFTNGQEILPFTGSSFPMEMGRAG